ncbi:hypothetical protein IW261DRAFT_1621216 [Armillaria novae-zelandiae]|uniref:Uncharacterized protein n=1 Tax=Armillaria novae-zelandiae TaxID=153914 RepID=A0AA39PVM4_9AGAR|nr:hypothetical protein IW261DRAFT_1621216 [Armillaria novae-zelandiae]
MDCETGLMYRKIIARRKQLSKYSETLLPWTLKNPGMNGNASLASMTTSWNGLEVPYQIRFVSLHMAQKSSGLEYFCVDHNHPMSTSSDWGPNTKTNPLMFAPSRQNACRPYHTSGTEAHNTISLALHVLGSIIGFSKTSLKMTPEKRKATSVHFTLLDIHPILARDLCLFMMVEELIHLRERAHDELEEVEIKATLLYIWMGVIIPSYCHARCRGLFLRDLSTSSFQPPQSLHVAADSIPDEMLHHHCDRLVDNPFSFASVIPLEFRVEDKWLWCTMGWSSTIAPRSIEAAGIHYTRQFNKTWKPKPSLFNAFDEDDFGYPNVEFRPFQMVEQIKDFNARMAYSIIEVFFDAVVDGLITLNGHVCIKPLQRDVYQELTKMAYNLSNVPDYTHGPMNIAAFTLPNLEPQSDASIAFDCLLNTGIWKGIDHFIYKYALLKLKDLARFFGCRVSTNSTWDDMELSTKPLPRPPELATRQELIAC